MLPTVATRSTPRREATETTIFADRVRPHWIVAHEIGCPGCKGTNYWATGDSWSFLDMILYSPALDSGSQWQMQPQSVAIVDSYVGQLNDDSTVRRFDPMMRTGVSDHLPLIATLEATSAR